MEDNKKIVLVTGGTSGIGLGIVECLLEQGNYHIIVVSKEIEKKTKVFFEKSSNLTFYKGDISNESDCERIFGEIDKKFHKLDGLVNCAGIIKLGGIETQTLTEWNNSININLTGMFMFTKILLPLIKKGINPSIVNISSIHSKIAGGSISYCVCKAGVDMLTKFMAMDLAKYKIRVNSVNPGAVKTNIYISSGDYSHEELDKLFLERNKKYPLGRVGNAKDDIGNMVEFLLSEKSLWITGSNFVVDGGKSLLN